MTTTLSRGLEKGARDALLKDPKNPVFRRGSTEYQVFRVTESNREGCVVAGSFRHEGTEYFVCFKTS